MDSGSSRPCAMWIGIFDDVWCGEHKEATEHIVIPTTSSPFPLLFTTIIKTERSPEVAQEGGPRQTSKGLGVSDRGL